MLTFKVVSQLVVGKNMGEISDEYLNVVGIARRPPDCILAVTGCRSNDHSAITINRYALFTTRCSAHDQLQLHHHRSHSVHVNLLVLIYRQLLRVKHRVAMPSQWARWNSTYKWRRLADSVETHPLCKPTGWDVSPVLFLPPIDQSSPNQVRVCQSDRSLQWYVPFDDNCCVPEIFMINWSWSYSYSWSSYEIKISMFLDRQFLLGEVGAEGGAPTFWQNFTNLGYNQTCRKVWWWSTKQPEIRWATKKDK